MASAAPTSTFLGSHPRRAQVPPKGLESTIATRHPSSRQRDATAEAADPVPIAITSNCLVIVLANILGLSQLKTRRNATPYKDSPTTCASLRLNRKRS